MENIFINIVCNDAYKIQFATFKVIGEAETWWDNMKIRSEVFEVRWLGKLSRIILWRNSFFVDLQNKKEVDFLCLKQRSNTVGKYAINFEELSHLYHLYCNVTSDRFMCLKFKNDMRLEIKKGVVTFELDNFWTMVYKNRQYEDACIKRINMFKKKPNIVGKWRALAPKIHEFKKSGEMKIKDKNADGGSTTPRVVKCGKCDTLH